jgi:hypothetical protein
MAIRSILLPFGIFCGHLVYFTSIWYILWPFDLFYCHLVDFVAFWYIFTRFGILYPENSGNPGPFQVDENKKTLFIALAPRRRG